MLSAPEFKPTSGGEERGARSVVSRSVASQIGIEEVFDDLIIYSDGSVGACWTYNPLYVDSLDEGGHANISAMLGAMLNNIPLGTSAQFLWRKDALVPVLGQHLSGARTGDPVVLSMTEDRVRHWSGRVARSDAFGISTEIWLRKFYPRMVRKPFGVLVNALSERSIGLLPKKEMRKYAEEHKDISSDFEAIASYVSAPLKDVFPTIRRADANSVLSSLWRYYTGEADSPRYTSYKPLRAFFGGWDMSRKWGYLTTGNSRDRLVSVVSVEMFPSESWLSMMSTLLCIPIPMTVAMNVTPVSMGDAKSFIRKSLRRYESLLCKIDPESVERCRELSEVLRTLDSSNNLLFDVEMFFVIEGSSLSELDYRRNMLLSEARGRDFTVNQEKAALELTFRAASPGFCRTGTTDREIRIKTENVVDFAPVLGPVKSADNPLMLMGAPYGSVYGYDMFDPRMPAYHGLIIGATGAGKSFTTNLLLLSAMAQNPQVYIIDMGGSYRKLAANLGGSYIDTQDPSMSFNPLAPKSEWVERMPTMILMLKEMAGATTVQQMILIERLLQTLFKKFELEDREPTMSDAWDMLDSAKLYEPDKEFMLKPVQDELRLAIGRWTHAATKGTGELAKLVDNPSTSVSLENGFVVFDLLGVKNDKEKTNILFLVLADLIRRKVTKSVHRRKIIVFDEAWSVLKSKEGALFLADLYKTMRKYNCMVLSISQSMEDFTDSDVSAALIGQTYQMFILRQNTPADADMIQDVLKLNDGERNIIATLTRKKGVFSEVFLKMSGVGSSRMSIRPSPVEYWLATTDPDDIKVFNNYVAEGYGVNEAVRILAEKFPRGVTS